MYPQTNLQKGQRGSEVTKLQNFLIEQGYTIPDGATGYFGDQTKSALSQWQKANGIQVAASDYGYWGPISIKTASSSSASPSLSAKHISDLEKLGYREGDFVPGYGTLLPDGTFRQENINQPTPTPTPTPAPSYANNNTNAPVDYTKQIESILETMIASGKTINPNLTIEDLADLDPADFLRQAEIEVSDEYKGKFAQVKDELTRSLTNIGYDLTKTQESNKRITEQNLEAGTEEISGRGLAFSGQRETFIKDTSSALSRANESAREMAFRGAQTAGTSAESKIGTSNLSGLSTPQIDGQRGFSFSSEPLTGSLVSERSFAKESMAKQLELDERTRRAFASSNLSFA